MGRDREERPNGPPPQISKRHTSQIAPVSFTSATKPAKRRQKRPARNTWKKPALSFDHGERPATASEPQSSAKNATNSKPVPAENNHSSHCLGTPRWQGITTAIQPGCRMSA